MDSNPHGFPYHLKGQIKTVSNIACEYIITSDKETLVIDFQTETNTYLNLFEQLLAEDEDIRKELEEEYLP